MGGSSNFGHSALVVSDGAADYRKAAEALNEAGDKGIRRGCQVVWRLGGEIGVAFVGPEQR